MVSPNSYPRSGRFSQNGTTGSRFAKRGLRFGSGKTRGAEPYMDAPGLPSGLSVSACQVEIAAIHPACWCSLELRALMEYAG